MSTQIGPTKAGTMKHSITKTITLAVFIVSFTLSMTTTIPGWTGIAFIATVASGTKFILDQWGRKIESQFPDHNNDTF